MTPRASFINSRAKASVTVVFTLVFTLIVSILLVTLEHAYVKVGQVVAYESLNRSMEAVLSNYYAPLFTQYGLLAIAVGLEDGFKDRDDVEKYIYDSMYEKFFTESSMFKGEKLLVELDMPITYKSDNLEFIGKQIKDAVLVDGIVNLGDKFSSLRLDDFKDFNTLLTSIRSQDLDLPKKEEDMSKDEKDIKQMYEDLLEFFEMGIAWYFFEGYELSGGKVDAFELPSFYFDQGEVGRFYVNANITVENIVDGSYIDELVDEKFFNHFLDIIKNGTKAVTDDVLYASYANLNMDNYLKDRIDGKLKYEQEYIIFGEASDRENLKAAAWSIFGVRVAANIIYNLKDQGLKDMFRSFLSSAIAATGIGSFIIGLMAVMLAVENAIVETCAILRGKAVDFTPTNASRPYGPAEVFSFSKSSANEKAEKYKAGTSLTLDYNNYLFVFMLMAGKSNLLKRIVDIIDINMKKLYDPKFNILQCYVGFNCSSFLDVKPRFLGWPTLADRSTAHKLRSKSAIRIPLGVMD